MKRCRTEGDSTSLLPRDNFSFAEFPQIDERNVILFEQRTHKNGGVSIDLTSADDLLIAINAIDGGDL